MCAALSAMFLSARPVLLLLLLLPSKSRPPAPQPARETSGTMCAKRNARCQSVHPARLPLSHLVATCHHLQPTTLLQEQGGGRGLAAPMVAPQPTGCRIWLAGTSLLESRRMRGWQNNRQAGGQPPILLPSQESQRTGTPCLPP